MARCMPTCKKAQLQPEQAGQEADGTGGHPDCIQRLPILPLALCLIHICKQFLPQRRGAMEMRTALTLVSAEGTRKSLWLGLLAYTFDKSSCGHLPGSCRVVPGGWKRPVGGSDIGSAYTFSGRPAMRRAPQHLATTRGKCLACSCRYACNSQRSVP